MPTPEKPLQSERPSRANTTKAASTKALPMGDTPAIRRTASAAQLNKRELRTAQRAAYRHRRNTVLSTLAAIVVVAALVALLATHWPFSGAAAKGAKTAKGACPTATVINGPAPAVTPPATPPPVSAKPVDDQGLQYVTLTPGCGDAVQNGYTVTVNYTGWLQSTGKLFDSSLNSGRTPFQVQNVGTAQVIQGWNIGLVGMKVGETRRLIIPPSLGYGAQANGPIPANATLIFDVTLLSIDSTQPVPTQPAVPQQ